MKLPTLKEMVEAGLHFGHKRERSNPKAKKYIFCLRDGIFIIDLEKTSVLLESALNFLTKSAKEGKKILFVGTKKLAKKAVEESAKKTEMPYMTERWLGGTLTNYETVRCSIKYLKDIENKKDSDEYQSYTKHEKAKLDEKIKKLHNTFDGILSMDKLPEVLFIFDAEEESNAVKEAIKKNIPIVAVCDTNSNPDLVDYPIIANDEASKSIQLIMNLVTEAVLEGKKGKK